MRRSKGGVYIPSSVKSLKSPAFRCTLCQKPFGEEEYGAFQRHVVKCSNEREQEIAEMSPRTKAPGIFGDKGWDTERERWMREHQQEILEGRLKP